MVVKETAGVGEVLAVIVGEAGVLEGDDTAHRVVAAAGERDADVALLAETRLQQPLPRLPLLERHRSEIQYQIFALICNFPVQMKYIWVFFL